MNNRINGMMALVSLFCLGMINSAQAKEGVGHGGGGEWNVVRCDGYVKSGQKLSVSVCLTGESNEQGQYEIIPCDSDKLEYVTIERFTSVATGADMIETIKVPGRLFSVDWTETQFSLKLNDSIAGDLNLVRYGSVDQDKGASLELSLPSMKHSLKSVSCNFGSN